MTKVEAGTFASEILGEKPPESLAPSEPITITSGSFPELSVEDLTDTLSLTIKRDNANKSITFLCMLSAYTEDAQFNISNNAPSCAGKSYTPNEIALYFPPEDVIQIGYCSPTSFSMTGARLSMGKL
jgi:hypothetical protein